MSLDCPATAVCRALAAFRVWLAFGPGPASGWVPALAVLAVSALSQAGLAPGPAPASGWVPALAVLAVSALSPAGLAPEPGPASGWVPALPALAAAALSQAGLAPEPERGVEPAREPVPSELARRHGVRARPVPDQAQPAPAANRATGPDACRRLDCPAAPMRLALLKSEWQRQLKQGEFS